MPKDPPRKPDSLPVKKPAPPKPAERLETTSLEAIGATLEDEKKKEDKPKGSSIATVIGVPALAAPEVPAAEKKEDKKEEKKEEKKGTIIGMPAAARPPVEAPSAPPPERIPTPEPILPALPTTSLKGKLREIIEGPRPRLYMFAGIAGAVVLIFLGVVIRLIRGAGGETAETASSASVASSNVIPPAVSSEAPVASPPPPPKIPKCTASRESKVIAPRGVVATGLELGVFDGAIELGWASAPKEASVATLDPATAGARSTAGLHASGTLKHVIPRSPADKSILDTDGMSPRPIGAYEVSSSGGQIVIAGKPLWKLESDAPAEALRGATTGEGIVIAYRHAGAIFVGATKGAEASGQPTRIAGLGPQIGSPAIAASGSHVIVAWADRAEASQPWGLRYFTWTIGEPPKPPESFPVAENAMSPSLTALAGGFLLVWTEGPTDHQQVRVRVLGFDGKPTGEAMTVSPEGVHSGQGQAALLPDGRGIVAFLSDTGKAFEVRTTTLRCD